LLSGNLFFGRKIRKPASKFRRAATKVVSVPNFLSIGSESKQNPCTGLSQMADSTNTPTKNSAIELLASQKAESPFSEFDIANFQDLGGDLQTGSMATIALPDFDNTPNNDCGVVKRAAITPIVIQSSQTGRNSVDRQNTADDSLEVVAEADDEVDSIMQRTGGLRVFADFLARVPEEYETMEASIADG
jgi:hypothetical protein